MTKLHFVVIILGSVLFLWEIPYGIGWLFGWFFMGLLRHFREPILEYIIDFDHFSTGKYIAYLFGVIVWISIPLVLSFFFPEYINPFTVFAAIFADRILMFFVNYFRKESNDVSN